MKLHPTPSCPSCNRELLAEESGPLCNDCDDYTTALRSETYSDDSDLPCGCDHVSASCDAPGCPLKKDNQ